MIKIIAIDLDNTLVKIDDEYFWKEYVPILASKRWQTSLQDAKKRIYKLYDLYPKNHYWYNPSFWEMILGVHIEKEYVNKFITKARLQIPKELIKELRKKYKVIIATNSPLWRAESILEYIDVEVDDIFSSDIAESSKNSIEFYEKMLQYLNAKPEELILFTDDSSEKIAEKLGIKVVDGNIEHIIEEIKKLIR